VKRYQMMAGLPIEIEVVAGGRVLAAIRGHVDSIRGSGGSMATAIRVVATDMATVPVATGGVAAATAGSVAMADAHVPGPPYQLSYPGGKDGMWQVDCSCGEYRTAPYSTAGNAAKVAWAHAYAKNGDQS
jgi:hypothetical protein